MPAAGGARQRTLIGMGGLCAPCAPPPPQAGGQRRRQWGGGLTRLGRRAGTHRALGEPTTGPWKGGGGTHLTQVAQSFRRAVTPGVGGGPGGPAQPVPDP